MVGTAATFPFLRSLMSQTPADMSLIDLAPETPSNTARDWLRELLELTPILLLNPQPDVAIFNQIRRAGVGGILQSNAPAEQVVQAIKCIASGDRKSVV